MERRRMQAGTAMNHDHHDPVPAFGPQGHPDQDDHIGHATHSGHAAHDPETFRRRFRTSLLLTLPLAVTGDMVMHWFGDHLDFPGMALVGPVLGSGEADNSDDAAGVAAMTRCPEGWALGSPPGPPLHGGTGHAGGF
jgi:hypothetical protein